MNKHLYRIIFNKARNMLMVVADIATSGQGSTVRRRSRRQSPQCLCRLTALRLSLLLATGCISLTAQANIMADGQAPGNQQPTILNSANGTPQIDIQTPNAAGISRNTYSQFDIDQRGVILNNSHNAVQTQLGGMVAGNPWLAKAEAKIILNEVNSINASKLNGWIEVAGQKADVIIANPAGITCNGCGFINAHRATLTTGQAMMEQGRLKGFDIDRGKVRIEGLGLDSSQQNYTEIIARSVVINGKLHAKDLKITTGRNIVDAAHQNIEKKSADGSENPSFTLDVAALGGMYANKIMLVGTEFGVGVRNAGHIGATAGEVRLTVDGQIENSGTIAARSNTIIKAESIQSASGSTLSAGIDNKGKATLPGSLTLTAKQHIQANGKNLATNTLEAQSKKIDLSGSQTSANNIQLTASQQEVSTANATVTADRFTAKAPGQFNNDGGTLVAREINLTTPDLSNNQGKINQTGNGELVLNTQTLNNQSGTLLNEGKRLAITTRNLDNHHGKIANNGNDLNLTVHEKADNTEGGTIQLAGKGKLSLTAKTLNNQDGEIKGNGNLKIDAATLDNSKGKIIAAKQGALELTVDDALNNQDGHLEAGQDIQLTATQLDNSRGKIVATGGSTELIIEKNIENVDGRIETKTELTTKSQALNNHQGSLLAQRIDSQTKGHKFTNTAGHVIAQEKLTLNSGELDNTSGLLQSGSDMIVNTHGQKLTNAKSDDKNKKGILSSGNLELRTGDINNTAGIISAKGKTTLSAGNVDNTDGQLLSQQRAELTTQALDNIRGQIQSESSLLLDTQNQALTNTDSGKTGGIIAKDSLRISSGKLTNDAGSIRGHGIHIDTHEQRLSNQKGTIASKKNLQLDSGELDSTSGQIKSDGNMTLDTHGKKLTTAKSSDAGGVTSEGTLTLTTGEIDNHDGTITGTGTTTITGGELHNQRGKLASKTSALTLTVNNTDNSGGLLQSAGDLTLDTKSGRLTNTNSGKDRGIISIGDMKLTTQGVNNDAGLIHAGKNLILDGQKGTITNSNSQPNQGIRSSGDLTLTASAIDNHQGSVEADKQLTVTSGTVDNTSGLLKSGTTLSLNTQGQKLTNAQSGEKRGIRSGSDLKLEAGEIDNTAGLIDAQGETSLTSQNLNNTSGKILSRKKADLTTQTVNNQSGLIQSATSLKLDTQQHELTSTDGGIIAEEALELATGKLINDRGSIRGDQTHINTHQQALNNVAGTIFSKKNLKLDSGELNSTGGRIESTGDMTLTTGEIDNQDGFIKGTGTTTVTGGDLKNQGGTLASETNTLTLTVKKTDNSGGLLKSADDLTLDTQGELLTNLNSGKTGGIISAGNVKLTAQGINNEAGWIHADKNLTLDGQQGKITNRNSQPKQGISSQGELTITAGAIDNQQGRIIADKQLNVTSTGAVDNTSGKMVSQHQQLTMNTGELNNTSGLLQSKTTLYLNTHGQKLTNTQSGDDLGIRSGSDLTLEAGEIDNTAGKIDSQGKTTLTSQNLNNTDGKILSKGKADLTTQAVNNQRGLIQSSASLKLDTQQHELINTDSGKNGIVAEDALELTTGKLINDRGDIRGNETRINTHQQALNNLAGTIFSKKNLKLDSGELDSTGGRIESTGDMTLTTGEIDNQDGFIKGTGTTTVTGGDLKNQGGTLASETGSLTLTVKKTDNSGGLLKSAGDLTLDTQGELLTNLNSGKTGGIISAGNVKLTTQGINNEAGWIHADKNLTLDGKQGKITNRNSQPKQGITSQGELTITAGAIDNQQGRIIADKQLNVTSTEAVDNTSGKIVSQNQQLTMNTGELNNTSGLLQSKTTLYLNTHGQKLTNTQSGDDLGIRSDSDLTLEAGEIDNTAGKIDSQGETKLTSQNLNNTDGKILSKGKADLTTQAVNNQRGLIQSSASLKLDTQQQKLTNTDSGEFNGILALDSLKLITGELINDLGYIRGDETHINSHQQALNNLAGTIVSRKNLQLDSGKLDSTGGLIKSDGNMTIDTHGKKLTTAKSGDTRGVISEGTMTLTADEIDNQDGFIKGTGTTTVTAGELKNQGGTLISEKGSLTLSVNQTDNSGGLLQSAGKLTLDTHGHSLTNKNSGDRGGIRSQDDMLITSGDLHNQAGTITNRKIATVNNLQNTIVGTQQIKLITQAFNNQQGKVHSDGNLNLNTQGQRLNNTGDKDKSGEFSAQGDLTLDIGELNNDASFIAADGKTKITSTTLTNKKGLIAGNSGLEIHSQTLTNSNGSLKSANTVNIDTNGQLLDNQHGRIIGDDNTTVTSGKLNNQHGHIQGKKLTIDTGQADTDNQDGKLLSTDTMNLNTLQLDNRRGQVKAIGNATINAPKQTNNTGGLIHSDQQLTLKTAELINRETHHPDQGTEARDLIIEAQQVDNTQGTLQGANRLQAIINQSLKNEQGLISGGKQLTIEDKTQKLTVNNRQGTLTGSEKVKIKANALSGDGQILSQGDMEVKLKQDFHNTGNIVADGKLSLETDGNIINDSTMKAEQAYLEAQNLTNTQTAEIRAKQTEVNVRNTLTNTGLIDGELTHLTANKVLDNTGTGRIYGDQIALKSGTLNNTAKDGKAAVIAARDRLDIGTGTLNNSNHAQIYSVGDMRIGGQLDENLAATSQAGRLSNHAATIEAGGSLKIDAAIIKNTNNGLVTDIVETEKSQRHEAVLSGRTARYDWSQVNTSRRNKYGVHRAVMPDGSGSEEFYEYRYTRTINETQIKESDPGKILSGGNMTINSAMLTNDDSQIVAGGILGGDIDELHNNATKGERIITDEGSEIRWYAKKKKRRFRGTKTSQGKDWDHYNPAPITETIDLKALAWQGNTRPNSTGITIDDRQTSRVQSTPTGINLTSRMAEAGEVTFTNATINAITLPNRDIPTDRPLLSPTGQQTEQLLSSGAVALPSRDALTEHPILSPTGQQTEQVLSSGAVVLPNRDALTEHPVLPPVQQTERVLPPVTVTLPNSGPLDERPLVLPTGQQFELTLPSDTVQGQSVEPLIRIVAPDTRLPANSLFVVQPGSDSHYLVETDPKFTQYKKWLGTDYMQQQLTHDPVLAHKRLGDGFYEQRLVRDQITQLTGQRYLAGHHNDETQFKALMEAGVAFSKQQQLTPGIALSPSQMALLTSDIIWLTNRTVTLPDGTTQVVTVPQVYARVNKGDLTGDGALLSGKNVTINSRRDITNSGTISGREVTQLAASNLTNSGFIQSGKVDLTARQDITNLGGQIRGRDRVSAQADRDITSASTLRGAGADRWQDRPAGIYVQNDNGTLSLKALNNIHLTASDVENAGKDSHTEIVAGRDLTLDTLKVQHTENSNGRKYNSRHLTQQTEMGSRVNSGGNLNVQAGQDISLTASQIGAQNSATLLAGQDIHLNAAQTLHHQTDNRYEVHQISGKVSHISSGDKLALNAGRDITTQATMTAKGPVQLVANRDIHLNAAQKSYHLVDNGYEVRQTSKEVSHISSDDKLSLNAGRDISTQATEMTAKSSAQLIAGRNMTHDAIEQVNYEASKGHKRQVIDEHRRQQVTEITSGKNTVLTAGHDLILKGTQVQAKNDITARAGHDIALKSVTESDYHFFEETKTKRKRFSKTTTHTVREDFVTHEKGATLSGNNVQIVADHNITMLGSAVAGDQKVAVIAGNDINVMSSAEQQTHYSMTQKKKSGLFSGGGIGFTIGKAKQKSTTDIDSNLSKGSTVGSSQGSVTLSAGKQLNIHGSDVVAGRDTQLSGQNIHITSAENSHTAITKT
ncbi:two-partner secretion domain-containing protein, partial [Photorhabdus sp. RW14-46]|uniref:two-partner secretion domain-containing protein n=1 Tax=Photorhabdus sp. RW14-46 TaxID=2100168 RepID=UPI0013F40118